MLAALLLALWAAGAPAQERFVAGIEDLPLMPGLSELTDRGVVFDKPGGRIVEAYAVGELAADRVESFYAETLPELGWRPSARQVYRREGEILRILLREEAGRLSVRFSIAPE